MNRSLILVGGAIVLIAAVGGVMTLDTSMNGDDVNNTDTSDANTPRSPGTASGPPTERNPGGTPVGTATPQPTIFAPDDPGWQSYPRNSSSVEEEIVASDTLSDYLATQINRYRTVHDDRAELTQTATLKSFTRMHSWDMHERAYFATTSPDGVTPVNRYNGTATECAGVTEYIFEEPRVVETADGERQDVSSEDIAMDIFNEMRDNRTMHDSIINESYNGLGVGTYVVGGENADGETTVTAYVTVDYCRY